MTAYENTVSLKRGEDSENPGELERQQEKIAGGETDHIFENKFFEEEEKWREKT